MSQVERIGLSLEPEVLQYLKVLARWEHRSASSQVAHLVTQAIRTKRTELQNDDEASAHFMAQLQGDDV